MAPRGASTRKCQCRRPRSKRNGRTTTNGPFEKSQLGKCPATCAYIYMRFDWSAALAPSQRRLVRRLSQFAHDAVAEAAMEEGAPGSANGGKQSHHNACFTLRGLGFKADRHAWTLRRVAPNPMFKHTCNASGWLCILIKGMFIGQPADLWVVGVDMRRARQNACAEARPPM